MRSSSPRGLPQIWGNKTLRAALLAGLGLLDNITTHYALEAGAREVNPLVAPFTRDSATFAVFTVFKVAALLLVAYKMNYSKTGDKLIYWLLVVLFAQATLVNALNALLTPNLG